MCGICGQYNFGTGEPVEHVKLRRMADSIAHRGPDDEGYYIDGPLGLGFRRLSIIDLEGGHQPMSNPDESVWIVFNGEIYNFPELKQILETRGHRFRTRSDTEVIIHGYEEWGTEVFNRLNGMFGLAIWDRQRRRLILARDAMGIKLVYYRLSDGCLTFGSEIRAITGTQSEAPEVDPVSLNLFIRYRFTPSPRTIFRGIRKLAPGTMLVIEDGHEQLRRWYRFRPEPFSPMPSPEEAGIRLLELYKGAVKRHLLSDVPVGLLLSGGIDSGLLLGLMNLQGPSWKTFTVGYGSGFKDDELVDARETACIFESDHTEVLLDQAMFEESLPKIVAALEEPIAASSIVPMYFVCQTARRDVKVALVGQGPDELFGGYRRHLGIQYGNWWASMPRWIREPIAVGIKTLPRNESLKRAIYSLDVPDRMHRYQNVLSIIPEERVDPLFREGLLPDRPGDEILECWQDLVPLMERTGELGGFQFLEVRSTLPDELLMYADKLSMAHSLEVRVPFLDREVVEYVERLSACYKVHHGTRKWLHRRVCRDFLPKDILKRKKRGFAVNVVDDWLRGSLNGTMTDVLRDGDSLMFRYLRPEPVHRLYKEHVSGRNDNHKLLFSLVVFEQWLRQESRN